MKRLALLFVPIVLAPLVAASASPSCMSIKEARIKYPRDHLWWHTDAHCWNNSRAAERPTAKAIPAPKIVDATEYNELDAQAGRPPPPPPQVYFPSLIPGLGTDPMFLDSEQMTHWPLLIDGTEQRFLPWAQRIAGTGLAREAGF